MPDDVSLCLLHQSCDSARKHHACLLLYHNSICLGFYIFIYLYVCIFIYLHLLDQIVEGILHGIALLVGELEGVDSFQRGA